MTSEVFSFRAFALLKTMSLNYVKPSNPKQNGTQSQFDF